jgi:hypothetical protein
MRVFSPVKNSVEGALDKVKAGLPAHSAATGEDDMYGAIGERLIKAGVKFSSPSSMDKRDWGGIVVEGWPRISFPPALAPDATSLKSVFPKPGDVSISSRSTMNVQGMGLVVER